MLGPIVTLVLISCALAWSVFFNGGVILFGRLVTLLAVGVAALGYWLATRRTDRAPRLAPWLAWPAILLPCYVVFQLVPLPISWLQTLSPARATLVQHLAPVIPAPAFAPLSVNPPIAVLDLFTLLGCLAVFLLVRELAWRFSSRPWAVVLPLLVIALGEAGIGMFQALTASQVQSAMGTYLNKDHFAGFLEIVLPVAVLYGVAVLRHGKTQFGLPMLPAIAACGAWAIAALVFLAIAYSLSRMGFLVALVTLFFIGTLVIGPRVPSRRWRWASFGVLSAVIVLILIFSPPDQMIRGFAQLSSRGNASGDTRLLVWKETLPLISEYHLFGCGLGGYESAFLKYQAVALNFRIDFAHNDYLQFLAELGYIGFGVLGVLVLGIFIQMLRGILRLRNEDRRLFETACAGAFVAILLHSLVDFNMYIPANAMTLAWIAGAGMANAAD